MNSLTTKETLRFATRLTLLQNILMSVPDNKSRTRAATISTIVDKAIDEFDLARAADSPIGVTGQGGISGGEKRLVIAMECAFRPKVLLLDEPTGLKAPRPRC